MIFGGANTYTGTTTISAGTLMIGNGGTTGPLGSVLLALEPLAHVAEASLNNAATPYGLVAWRATALALMAYRQGRFKEALEWCHRASNLDPGLLSRQAVGDIVQAMAEWQVGQKAAARVDLEHARMLVESGFKRPLRYSDGAETGGFWHDWLNARILLREAEALIQKPESAQWHGS